MVKNSKLKTQNSKRTLRTPTNRLQPTTMDKLMDRLFDIKEKLTDAEYKGFCEDIAEQYKTKDNAEGYCELTFPRFLPSIDVEGGQSYTYRIKIQRLIIKMNCDMSKITSLENKIEQSGSTLITRQCLTDIVGNHDQGRDLWHEYMAGHQFCITSAKHEDDDDIDGTIYAVHTSVTWLQDAHSVPLISIKML